MALTAQQVVDGIRNNLGNAWMTSSTDTFQTGSPETAVTGVVTTYAATLEVLRRAAASGKNMIISREAPFWERTSASGATGRGRGPARAAGLEVLAHNPTYQFKKDYIAENKLVIWRFSDNWGQRKQDGQLIGLAKALGWERHYKATGEPWARDSGYFAIPSSTLRQTALSVKASLKMKSMRIIGDPNTRVSRAILSPGYYAVSDLEKHLSVPGVDLIVIGEPVEWEASPYFMDVVASGQKKGLIVLGSEVSQESGSGEVAAWLKTFIREVQVEWIPAGEPSWMPY